MKAGDSVIDIWLADDWWRSRLLWTKTARLDPYGDKIAAIAEVCSGGKAVLKTDATWTSGRLPVMKSGIYFGDIYDARAEGLPADKGAKAIRSTPWC